MLTPKEMNDLVISGDQYYFAEGIDYIDSTKAAIARVRACIRRHDLRIELNKTKMPPGFVCQAYTPDDEVPILGQPQTPFTKELFPNYFCVVADCDLQLLRKGDDFCMFHSGEVTC